MCKHLVSLVYLKRTGSAVRKAVLGYMADRASEDGDGIYTSKGRIARETEFSESAVKKAIREFISEGILVEVGKRGCANGQTVVYAMCRAKIEALPDAKDGGKSGPTPAPSDPVTQEPRHRVTPTPAPSDPHPGTGCPQTTLNHLEPQKDHSASQNDPRSFSAFWEAWPLRKVGKAKAQAAFNRLSQQNRREAIRQCRAWAQRWRAAYPGASDMHPTSFLNGKRWEDDFGQATVAGRIPQQMRTEPRGDDHAKTFIPSQSVRDDLPPPSNRYGRIQ